jgi:DNA-directed RNA polymerase subunit E'/Rpb7
MEEELVNPFVIKKLATRVELYPHQMDSELYLNLKKNLKISLEGKCNKFGFIHKIIRIEDYTDNIINPENFSGNAVYNIHYIANICIPLVKTVIVTCVDNFNKRLLLGKNGPIDAIIKITDMNPNVFTIKPDGTIWINSQSRALERGNYIKIIIDGKKFSPGDDKIGVMGKVLDIATEEEVEEFFTPSIKENTQEQLQTQTSQYAPQVEFNEDGDFTNEMDKKNGIEIKTNISEI